MTDTQTKEKYKALAEKWNVTQKLVAEASKHVYEYIDTKTQEEFENAMKTFVELKTLRKIK